MIEIRSDLNYSVIFQHEVKSITPLTGSQNGRTLITIYGYGIDSSTITTTIGEDSKTCDIVQKTYNNLTCYTPSGVVTSSKNVSVSDPTLYNGNRVKTFTGFVFKYESAPFVESVLGSVVYTLIQKPTFIEFNVSNVLSLSPSFEVHFNDYVVKGGRYSLKDNI